MNNSNTELLKNKIIILTKQTQINNKKLIKLQRIIFLIQNNVKVYIGFNGGYYYYSYNNKKIYI